MQSWIRFGLFAVTFLLSACSQYKLDRRMANFDKRYNEYVSSEKSRVIFENSITYENCQVVPVNDHVSAAKEMAQNGYVLIGDVMFPGRPLNSILFKTHCGRKGAEKALLSIDLASSKTFQIPYTHQNVSYAQTTIQGQRGNYLGNLSTTSKNYETRYITYNVNSYRNWSSYWIKAKPPIFGAYYDELPDSAKYESESNYGAYVYLIVKNSPAYFSNIIIGDVITAVDGRKVFTPSEFTDVIMEKSGKEIAIELKRKGESRTVKVRLGTL